MATKGSEVEILPRQVVDRAEAATPSDVKLHAGLAVQFSELGSRQCTWPAVTSGDGNSF